MRRLLMLAVIATAAVATLCMGVGVGAPPHRMPPGTPLFHTLALGAYRYGFLLEPVREADSLSPQMAALHKALALGGIPMPEMPGMAASGTTKSDLPLFTTGKLHPLMELAIVFALLLRNWPRLPRPTRRQSSEVSLPSLRAPQWRPALPTGPPRMGAVPAI